MGLSVGLFFLLLFIGIPICIVIIYYRVTSRSSRCPTVQTRVVATTPSSGGTTVVTSNQTSSPAAPVPYYQLQPFYRDAQLSDHNAPPSYTAFPSQATPQLVYCVVDVSSGLVIIVGVLSLELSTASTASFPTSTICSLSCS